MKNAFKTKKIVIISLMVTIIAIIVFNILPKNDTTNIPDSNNTVRSADVVTPGNPQIYKLCYYNSDKTSSGLYDVSYVGLNVSGESIKGEFNFIPAEKDSKVGLFEGNVGPLVSEPIGQKALVWWNSLAEGMRVKEELEIIYGDGVATVGFGEMEKKEDGVYTYKDKENLTYIKPMVQINCETLGERLSVEKYIKNNIGTIATNSPVLGGSWYTTMVFVNPSNKSGEVTYEDGHIQSKASFTYNYTINPEIITIIDFKVK